jgi:hypothetical protein
MLRTALILVVLISAAAVIAPSLFRPAPASVAQPPLHAPTAAASPTTAPAPDPEAITLSEAGLTAQANRALAGQTIAETPLGPAVVENLTIRVAEGQILTDGTARAGAVSLPIAASFSVTVVEGRPVVAVRTASLGGIPLPEPTLRALERAAQAPVDQALSEQRVRIRSVTMRPGVLTLITAR